MSVTHKTNLFLSLYGINKLDGCVIITGTIDKRQTTVYRMILEKQNRKKSSEFVPGHFINEDKRLASILQNAVIILGKNTEKRTKTERIYQLIQFLLNALKDGESALLLIDDTQNILLPLPEQTRILSSLEAQKEKRLQIILVGKRERIQSLCSPQFKQTDHRLSVKHRPVKLKKKAYDIISANEMRKYIEYRLMATDSTEGINFSQEALAFIRNNSLGIPCMTNLIFDGALMSAHTQKTTEITEEIVENTVENFTFPKKETGIAIPEIIHSKATWINRMRTSVIIPSIISIFIGAIAIGFFISQNIMIKKAPDYKPEQELPILQYKLATPEDIEKAELFKLAIFYQKSGELIKAKEQYMELIKRHPIDHEIHNNLGSVYQALGDLDTAINEYRTALLINPNYHKARNNLGVALYENGNLQAAISEFKIIYEVKPKDVQCLTNLGVLSKELKHFDKAREFFEEVLSIDPEFTEAHYNLAMILKEKDVASAIFHFQKFLEYSDGQYASLEEKVIQHLDNLSNKPKVYSRNW